ncbi:1-phosphofructokinase family hexose kinase [Ornithinimicrobium cerasi]|uniref:Fructose-1-phosphate kinase n=1 Tax=Ornithinimicrobium cerasi TaxID=2248773 RepID=A0A285VRP9_9MICO|nr:1-phosphofructokinase family hexose kinase [Ornithinimicrobium cerasi]SOC56623.1 fructose-1-phosphate kinase [Ornithinimicrobium cerasi]
MIVTLTPNPSIDRSISLPQLLHGEVNRASASRVDPGGKGINVSRAIAAQGSRTLAVLPAGGPEGALMVELLRAAGVDHLTVPVAGTLRMNVALLEPDGTTTKVNEPGPSLTDADVEALLARTVEGYVAATSTSTSTGTSTATSTSTSAGTAAGDGSASGWVVGCGSLPPGAPVELFAMLVERARAVGARVAVDSSGAPLAAAVQAGPDLIKPNLEELEELVGAALPTLADVGRAAEELVRRGVGRVVVSLGGDGALVVGPDGTAHASAAVAVPLSTVGAGDCLLAGVLHALDGGLGPGDALAAGVRWGSAAVALPGSAVPTAADVAAVHAVLTPDPDLTTALR